MSYDDNNIFAKILRGEIPCNKIYEDEFEDKERGSYSHRRRVVWLSQGPVLKSDFPDEHFGGSLQAAHEVHDPAKKIFVDFLLGEKYQEYFLLVKFYKYQC